MGLEVTTECECCPHRRLPHLLSVCQVCGSEDTQQKQKQTSNFFIKLEACEKQHCAPEALMPHAVNTDDNSADAYLYVGKHTENGSPGLFRTQAVQIHSFQLALPLVIKQVGLDLRCRQAL